MEVQMNKLKCVLLLFSASSASYAMNADREEGASKNAIELSAKISLLEIKDNGKEKKEEENLIVQMLINNDVPGLRRLKGIALTQDSLKKWATHYYKCPTSPLKSAAVDWVLLESNLYLTVPTLKAFTLQKAAELVLTKNLKIDSLPQDIKDIFWSTAPTFSFLKNQITGLNSHEIFLLCNDIANDTIKADALEKVKRISALRANYIRDRVDLIVQISELFYKTCDESYPVGLSCHETTSQTIFKNLGYDPAPNVMNCFGYDAEKRITNRIYNRLFPQTNPK